MQDNEMSYSNEIKSQLEEKKHSSEKVYDGKQLQVYVDDVILRDGTYSTRD